MLGYLVVCLVLQVSQPASVNFGDVILVIIFRDTPTTWEHGLRVSLVHSQAQVKQSSGKSNLYTLTILCLLNFHLKNHAKINTVLWHPSYDVEKALKKERAK